MRLAALKNKMLNGKAKPEYEKLLNLAEVLATGLIGILTVATNANELIWEYEGSGVFSCEFKGANFSWNRSNNEPARFFIEGSYIQDDGSSSYGFKELSDAIWVQYSRLKKLKTISKGPIRTHPYRHPNRED